MAEEKGNRLYSLIAGRKPGNILSMKSAGTSLTKYDLGLLDHAHRMMPAMAGGLMALSFYQWGIRTFKITDSANKHFWQFCKTDESAGGFAIWLLTWLLLRFVPGDTTERFCAGLVGRGSIVIWNTLMRWFGKNDWIRINQADMEAMTTQIEVVPAPANQAVATPPVLSEAELDEELIKEVGRLAQRSPEFQEKVSAGFARRINEYLDGQGRKQIDTEEVNRQVIDLFNAMARR